MRPPAYEGPAAFFGIGVVVMILGVGGLAAGYAVIMAVWWVIERLAG